jgi:hypothetical protein
VGRSASGWNLKPILTLSLLSRGGEGQGERAIFFSMGAIDVLKPDRIISRNIRATRETTAKLAKITEKLAKNIRSNIKYSNNLNTLVITEKFSVFSRIFLCGRRKIKN